MLSNGRPTNPTTKKPSTPADHRPETGGSRTTTRARSTRRSALAAVVAVGALALAGCGQAASVAIPPDSGADVSTPSARPFDDATVAELDALVRQFKEVNQTPGVLVGIWSPQGTYVVADGVADITTNAPLEPDMQFKIASQTKSFTGNLVLQLVGEGKVGLDDHISKWIDGVPNGDRITVRQLLNHTSGLADGFTDPSVMSSGSLGVHGGGAADRRGHVPAGRRTG